MKGETAPKISSRPAVLPAAWPRDGLFGLLLVICVLVAFAPALRAGFIWDDDVYVTKNPLLTAPDGLRRIWFSLDSPSQYFPLTYTTFFIERSLWGLNPAGYHLINLLLHGVSTLLVWRLLARLSVPGAWLAAAIFALHPVQVESVAWITERKNVLMGVFFLLTLSSWVRFINDESENRWRHYILALITYALALSAKTTACTLPAALLLMLWLKKIPITRRRLVQVAPFVAMGIAMGLLTVWWERHNQGTQGSLFAIGPIGRVLIASRALWFYLGKLLWPVNLTFSYPHWNISASDPRAYVWLLAAAGLAVVIWWTRRWTGRSVEVAAMYFAATLCPVLGFIMLYTFLFSFVADHYQYLACIGPIALVAAAVETGLNRVAVGQNIFKATVSAVLLLTLGGLTWNQCGDYADAETLWCATIARNPGSWMARLNLGLILLNSGDDDDAITQFQKAADLAPNEAKAYYNLGVVFFRQGKLDEAIAEYRETLSLDPNMAGAHDNLGIALLRKGQLDEAIVHLEKALALNPRVPDARRDLGLAFAQKGQMTQAIAQFRKALESDPDDTEARRQIHLYEAKNPAQQKNPR